MPSNAYRLWATARARSLNELEAAHTAVGGTGPGRRYATRQVNHGYAVLLAAEFQGFCRQLHDECVAAIVAGVPAALRLIIEANLLHARQLDRGNATPASLGADFGRFDIPFWPGLAAWDFRVPSWQRALAELNDWRNAIAHNDFDPSRLGGTILLRLAGVRRFRRACRGLARTFDGYLAVGLTPKIGRPPW